jgi:YVTN family beta-propeller protein
MLLSNGVHAGSVLSGIISVGNEPEGLAYDYAMGEIFVANAQSSSLSVISDSNNSVVATVCLPSSPSSVAFDSGKGEIFAANYLTPCSVYVISDINYSLLATVPLNSSVMAIAYDSAKGEIFTANFGGSSVSIISDRTNTVIATIPVGYNPSGIAYDAAKGEVFVTNLVLVDNVTHVPNSVSIISDSNDTVIANIYAGFGDGGLVYDSQKGEIFAASSQASSVEVISDSNNSVVATIPVGAEPFGLAYDSGKGEIFVTHASSLNALSVISDANNTMISNMTMTAPAGLAYDSGVGSMYISNWYGSSVSVISDSSVLPPPTYINTPTPTFSPFPTLTPPPINLSIPLPTTSSQPGLTVSETPTVSNNSVRVYLSAVTGVNVTVEGPSLLEGTQVNVTTADYGSKPPIGTAGAPLNNAVFYDVSVASDGAILGSDVTATISIADPSFSSSSVIEYFNGSAWTPITTNFSSPNTVTCTIPVSVLTGTPFAVGTTKNSGSGANLTEIIYGLIVGIAVVAATVMVLTLAMREKDAKQNNEFTSVTFSS